LLVSLFVFHTLIHKLVQVMSKAIKNLISPTFVEKSWKELIDQ